MATLQINWTNLPGQKTINRIVLPNGIRVLSFSNFNTKTVYLVGLLNCGSVLDPGDKLGLAHFTAGMLTRGTSKRKFNEIHQELEERGASLTFSCGSNHTWFRGKALAEDARSLFELSAECLQLPIFDQEYFDRMRSQLLTGLAIRDQDTAEIASLLFDHNLFPDHPYGQPLDGYPVTIQNINRDDLTVFHRQHYSPNGMMLVIAGAITGKAVNQLAEKYFAGWGAREYKTIGLPELPPPPATSIRQHRKIEEKSQVDLIMGVRGPQRISKDFLPAYLGNNILGQFGLMGRIGESVRSRSGLAYYASSSLNSWTESGTWEFSAGTNEKNLKKTIQLIKDEIERFISTPVSQEELANSKSFLVGHLPITLETNAGLANAILTIERFQLGLDYYQRYAEMVNCIEVEEILSAAQKYLDPARLVIASAGPGEDIG